jgi:hypothetical protein
LSVTLLGRDPSRLAPERRWSGRCLESEGPPCRGSWRELAVAGQHGRASGRPGWHGRCGRWPRSPPPGPGRRPRRQAGPGRGGAGQPPAPPPGGVAAAGPGPAPERERSGLGVCELWAGGPPRCVASRPLCGPVPSRHRRDRPGLSQLCPAAHAHRVASLAPLALVGPSDRGRPGRQPAGDHPCTPTLRPVLPGDREPVRPNRPRRRAAGQLPADLRRHQSGRGRRRGVAGGAAGPARRGRHRPAPRGRAPSGWRPCRRG